MARSTGMAGTAAQSGIRSEFDHVETGRAWRRGTTHQSAFAQRQIACRRKTGMNRSRRKNWNTVDAASLARWIGLTAFLALTGLSYVYLTLQLYHLGDRKKALENELASIRTQNDVASVQIAALTSRPALRRGWRGGFLKVFPIG